MDADTKQILKELCAVVRDSTEQAFHAHELAEKLKNLAGICRSRNEKAADKLPQSKRFHTLTRRVC